MKKIYFTITGTNHYYGTHFMNPGMQVKLVKEPENDYDKEAIQVKMDGLGVVGYVANSIYSIKGESMSAGRLYDKFNKIAYGTILYVLDEKSVVCFLNEENTHSGKYNFSTKKAR